MAEAFLVQKSGALRLDMQAAERTVADGQRVTAGQFVRYVTGETVGPAWADDAPYNGLAGIAKTSGGAGQTILVHAL